MCFTMEISNYLMVGGSILTLGTLYFRNLPLTMVSLYYLGMELLQRHQMSILDRCNLWDNQVSTMLAMFLVSFQPALWNWYRLHKNTQNKSVFQFAMISGLIWAFAYLRRSVQTSSYNINYTEIMASDQFCVLSGSRHLYWKFPLYTWNGFEPNFFSYFLLWFLPTLWEDHYRWTKLTIWIGQVVLSIYLSDNYHEIPAIWCFMSIPIISTMSFLDFVLGRITYKKIEEKTD